LETKSDEIVNEVKIIAHAATEIPLSVFTDLFHKRFPKKPYLESTSELLQQFCIASSKHSEIYQIFPGDEDTFCLKCMWCGLCITKPDYIDNVLCIAPYAILYHLGIIKEEDAETEYSGPLMFSSHEEYDTSKYEYWNNYENKEPDETLVSYFGQCGIKSVGGKISICEAIKVDLAISHNASNEGVINSTLSLVSVLC